MRYCLVALLLFAVLPLMNVLAALAPAPFAILDIGPPMKGMTAEAHRDLEIRNMTFSDGMINVWYDPAVTNMPSVVRFKDPRPWMSKNLRITQDGEINRLRVQFQAGNRAEQVAIVNSLLRYRVEVKVKRQQRQEEILRLRKESSIETVKLIEKEVPGRQFDKYREWLKNLSAEIADLRAQIAGLKQFAVIRWAK